MPSLLGSGYLKTLYVDRDLVKIVMDNSVFFKKAIKWIEEKYK